MLYINQFLDRLKAADARQQRDFTMSIQDARNLHADITKLLLAVQAQTAASPAEPTEIEISGGGF